MDLAPFLDRLAKAINEEVPSGFERQPKDMEWAFWSLEGDGQPKPSRQERVLRDAAIRVLDTVQDDICEGLLEPWPNEGIAPVPAVRGKVVNHRLELWFEVDGTRVLVIPTVSLWTSDSDQ